MIRQIAVVATVMLSACNQASSNLTIADIEKAGLDKEQKQLYEMVGVTADWSGRWNDEVVEVYTFAESDLEKNPFYTSTVVDSNYSNWAYKYIHKNVILLSKGTESCHSLSQL